MNFLLKKKNKEKKFSLKITIISVCPAFPKKNQKRNESGLICSVASYRTLHAKGYL